MFAYFIGGSRDLSKEVVQLDGNDEPPRLYRVCRLEPFDLKAMPREGELAEVHYECYYLVQLSMPPSGEPVAIYLYDPTLSPRVTARFRC